MEIPIISWITVGSCSKENIPAFLFHPTLAFDSTLTNRGNPTMIEMEDQKFLCTFDETTSFGPCPSNLTFRQQFRVGFLKNAQHTPTAKQFKI